MRGRQNSASWVDSAQSRVGLEHFWSSWDPKTFCAFALLTGGAWACAVLVRHFFLQWYFSQQFQRTSPFLMRPFSTFFSRSAPLFPMGFWHFFSNLVWKNGRSCAKKLMKVVHRNGESCAQKMMKVFRKNGESLLQKTCDFFANFHKNCKTHIKNNTFFAPRPECEKKCAEKIWRLSPKKLKTLHTKNPRLTCQNCRFHPKKIDKPFGKKMSIYPCYWPRDRNWNSPGKKIEKAWGKSGARRCAKNVKVDVQKKVPHEYRTGPGGVRGLEHAWWGARALFFAWFFLFSLRCVGPVFEICWRKVASP